LLQNRVARLRPRLRLRYPNYQAWQLPGRPLVSSKIQPWFHKARIHVLGFHGFVLIVTWYYYHMIIKPCAQRVTIYKATGQAQCVDVPLAKETVSYG
jgi:hypothetical protein